jgi:hypothetical protein
LPQNPEYGLRPAVEDNDRPTASLRILPYLRNSPVLFEFFFLLTGQTRRKSPLKIRQVLWLSAALQPFGSTAPYGYESEADI